MANVCLVGLNSKYVHSCLAVYCLEAGIKEYAKEDIKPIVIERTIHNDMHMVADEIMAHHPFLVGISTYIWNVEKVFELVDIIKSKDHDVKICLGGPEVSYNQYDVLAKHDNVDFISAGEGEYPFALLCDTLISNSDLDRVMGLSYRDNGSIVVKEAYVGLDDPVSPYTDTFMNNVNKRIVYIETTRGCPYSCDYCLSGRCGKVRYFDLDKTFENIIKLANSSCKTIKFVDRTFNANKKRSKAIISFIINNSGKSFPSDVCFHFEVAGDILDDETIELLGSAPKGLFQLEIGMQSFNEKTLAYINRKTNTDILKKNIRKLLSYNNMHIHIDLIVGLPFEDMNSLRDSFNTGYYLNAHMLQLGFLKILHGATMDTDKKKYHYHYDDKPPYEIIDTDWLTKEEMADIHALEDVLDRMNNSGRFLNTLNYLLDVTKSDPFDLLMGFGLYAKDRMDYKIDLDHYTALIYDYFKTLDNVDSMALRDQMVIDRLSTNASGKLCECLKIADKNIKPYRMALDFVDKPIKNIKRGLEVLYSLNKVVYVDYQDRDVITNQYVLKYQDPDFLMNVYRKTQHL